MKTRKDCFKMHSNLSISNIEIIECDNNINNNVQKHSSKKLNSGIDLITMKDISITKILDLKLMSNISTDFYSKKNEKHEIHEIHEFNDSFTNSNLDIHSKIKFNE